MSPKTLKTMLNLSQPQTSKAMNKHQTHPRRRGSRLHALLALLLLGLTSATLGSCGFDEPEESETLTPAVQPFFNTPGTRQETARDRLASDFIVQQFDEAKVSLDLCIYGLSRQDIIDAALRAHERGVKVRVVGDARHLQYGGAYNIFTDKQIPMQVGNQFHIMHNKFFLIDGRYVFVGTGNITSTGFDRNNNNWLYIDSIPVAQDFQAEFNQMFEGRFSSAKERIDNGESYEVGDTEIEVYFSPQEDTMGKVLEELEKVDTSVHFQIFAFTKDQIGSSYITKHRDFMAFNEAEAAAGRLDPDWKDKSPLDWPKKVVGVLDRSQLHGNGQYHEGYRLQAFGVPMRLDGNENSQLPGDYQAGGGRLHTKTMILDAGTPNARVITGSFNWSSSATISNDEVLMILRGERMVKAFMDEFVNIWEESRSVSKGMCYYMDDPKPDCAHEINPGDVLISEVHWDGWNGQLDPTDHTDNDNAGNRDEVTNDEFIELYNPTDRPINLSMWTLTNRNDFIVGFTPGTVIMPGQHFLVLDHNTAPYLEGEPQRGQHAFLNPDFVLNMANDPRFLSMQLKRASLALELRDSTGRVIDQAGNRGTPFWGGRAIQPDGEVLNFSMERIIDENGKAGDGTHADSWKACSLEEGGKNVAEPFRDRIIATPGEPNSP